MKNDCFKCKTENDFKQDCASCINSEVDKIVDEHIYNLHKYILLGAFLILLLDFGLLYIFIKMLGE